MTIISNPHFKITYINKYILAIGILCSLLPYPHPHPPWCNITLSISSLSLYTGPKVQAHHLLIRQKECNEIINVLELIMNMIKKAKISGARISLPIQS